MVILDTKYKNISDASRPTARTFLRQLSGTGYRETVFIKYITRVISLNCSILLDLPRFEHPIDIEELTVKA